MLVEISAGVAGRREEEGGGVYTHSKHRFLRREFRQLSPKLISSFGRKKPIKK